MPNTQAQELQNNDAADTNVIEEPMTVAIIIESPLKEYVELVFAYNMRDEIAVRGQLAVQKEFPSWLQGYLLGKLKQESEAIEKRIEDKKARKVLQLMTDYGFSLADAQEKIYGRALTTISRVVS